MGCQSKLFKRTVAGIFNACDENVIIKGLGRDFEIEVRDLNEWTVDQLFELVDLCGTKKVNVNNYNLNNGCETCGSGNSYGVRFQVKEAKPKA